MDLALYDVKVPATKDFLKNTNNLWNTIYYRESHQAIKDKSKANEAQKPSTIQVGGLVMLKRSHLVLKVVTGKQKPRFVGPFRAEAQV